ncbi:MAG: PAS domain S-box protein [Sedimenticola sp.]
MTHSSKTYRLSILPLIIILSLAIVVLFSGAYLAQKLIASETQKETGQALESVLKSSHQALVSWRKSIESEVALWANSGSLQESVSELLNIGGEPQSLKLAVAQVKLRQLLMPVLAAKNYHSFFIIDRNLTNLSSGRDDKIGAINPLYGQQQLMERVWSGETVTNWPLSFGPHLSDKQDGAVEPAHLMFVVAPIYDQHNQIVAALTLHIDPEETFARILSRGRIGVSGETYAFDAEGMMISQSRFSEQLNKAATPDNAQVKDYPAISIRDPGVDLTTDQQVKQLSGQRPLTLMAQSAITSGSGNNLIGYRDYRGVPVIGVWLWDKEWGLGVTTELDVEEAYLTHRYSNNIINGLTLLGILLLLSLALLFDRGRRRTQESELRQRTVLENVIDSIITIDSKGIIIGFQGGAEKQFGYREEEVMGCNASILMPQEETVKLDGYIQHYISSDNADLHGIGREVIGRRKDGSEFLMDLGLGESEIGGEHIYTGIVRDITARREVEEQLDRYKSDLEKMVLERTEQLNKAQAIAHLGHWEWNILTDEVKWSDEVYRIFDKEPHNTPLSYEYFLEMVHPDDREQMSNAIEKVFADPDFFYRVDHRIVLQTGEERFVQERGECLRDTEGRPVRMLGTVQDLTELRLTEQELSQSEERFKLALLGSSDGVWDWNLKTNEVFYSERWMEMLGYHDGEWAATLDTWKSLINPDDGVSVLELVQAVIDEGGDKFKIEFSMMHRDGHWVPILSRGFLQRDPGSGEALRLVGTHLDLSERVDAEQALKRVNEQLDERVNERTVELENSRKIAVSLMRDAERMKQRAEVNLKNLQESTVELHKLQQAVEQSPVSIIITNPQGTIEYVNPYTTKLSQYSSDELLGQKVSKMGSGEQPQEFYSELWQTISMGDTWHGEICNRKKDDTLYWESITISPVKDSKGEVVHYIAVKDDITEQRTMHEALIVAKNQAEAATRAKSDFVANMSHEIRTPMNAIIGMSHLALGAGLTGKQRSYIEKVHHSAEGLLGIISDILDFSKIEAGKMEVEKVEFQLDEVMDNFSNLVGLKADEKDIQLIFNMHPSLPKVFIGDPLRLGQVLINLGTNAVKFTEQGGEVLVSTNMSEETEGQALLHFSIEDNGIGITEVQQEILFQSFSQADSSTTRRYGGTGLGLAISKQLVSLMGGDIWLESEYGSGSTFHFTIGVKKKEQNVDVNSAMVTLMQQRILVVDGSLNSRQAITDMLAKLGFRVDSVASGEAAAQVIEEAEEDPYEILLIDWQVPGRERLKATLTMRETKHLPLVQAVVMANTYAHESVQDVFRQFNLSGFLVKPVTPASLLKIAQSISGQEAGEWNQMARVQTSTIKAIESLYNANVLLVEDNEVNQELARELLVSNGLGVEVVNNGIEALKILEEQAFDGVLMDCRMPLMDGYAATREIRKNPRLKQLPIIAMTADVMDGDYTEVLTAGMNDHIAKPIRTDEMFATMAKWIVPDQQHSNRALNGDRKGTLAEALNSIEGVDTDAGLLTVNGDAHLYHRLLLKFRNNQTDFIHKFHSALSDQDLNTAIRHAHTLKGLAGSIGALSLQVAAAKLERACTADIDSIDQVSMEVDAKLRQVFRGLDAIAFPIARDDTFVPTTPEKALLEPLLRELHTLATRHNVNADKHIGRFRTMLEGSEYEPLFAKVVNAIERYDFDGAITGLEDLADKLDISL